MTDRQKIINDLIDFEADLRPFCGNHADWKKVSAAIIYLKQPVTPVFIGNDEWQCPDCETVVGWEELECGGISKTRYKYCPECGRVLKWNA